MTKLRLLAMDLGISDKYKNLSEMVNVELTMNTSLIIDNVFLDGDRTKVSERVLAVVMHSYEEEGLKEVLTEMKRVNFPVVIYQRYPGPDEFFIKVEGLMYDNISFVSAPYELKRKIKELYTVHCKESHQKA